MKPFFTRLSCTCLQTRQGTASGQISSRGVVPPRTPTVVPRQARLLSVQQARLETLSRPTELSQGGASAEIDRFYYLNSIVDKQGLTSHPCKRSAAGLGPVQ